MNPVIADEDLSTGATPSYAVVLKAHVWDGFIARQMQRYRQRIGHGTLFLFVDETAGSAGPIPLDNVLRATKQDAVSLQLADRSEQGSLFWWNTDYPHYIFFDRFPSFDYYVFSEYDALMQRDIDGLVLDVAAAGADLVALPTRGDIDGWMWTKFHLATYRRDEIAGSLNSLCILSRRALLHLYERRVQLSIESDAGRVRFWPFNEVFVATETVRAGFAFRSLSEFGNTDAYEWFPPHLEEDVEARPDLTFVHPILDRARFIPSMLKFENNPLAYYWPGSRLRRALSRFDEADYRPLLWTGFHRRIRFRSAELVRGATWQARAWATATLAGARSVFGRASDRATVRAATREGAMRSIRRVARQALPAAVVAALQRLRTGVPPKRWVRFGDLGRTDPIDDNFGFGRGKPIDRFYIEAFLERHAGAIAGRVLEIGDAAYSRQFGGSRVVQQDVLHVRADAPGATIIGDLSMKGVLPPSAFDCIVLTQTLHIIYDMHAALVELHASMKPGGVLLLTVPGISQLDRYEWNTSWFWSLTPAAVSRLLADTFYGGEIMVGSDGNVFAAVSFLHGLAVDEVPRRNLLARDTAYPVVVTAVVRKAREGAPA